MWYNRARYNRMGQHATREFGRDGSRWRMEDKEMSVDELNLTPEEIQELAKAKREGRLFISKLAPGDKGYEVNYDFSLEGYEIEEVRIAYLLKGWSDSALDGIDECYIKTFEEASEESERLRQQDKKSKVDLFLSPYKAYNKNPLYGRLQCRFCANNGTEICNECGIDKGVLIKCLWEPVPPFDLDEVRKRLEREYDEEHKRG